MLVQTITIVIPLDQTGPYYQSFYVLAMAIGFLLLIYEGYLRKYPISTWLIILAFVFTAIILGSKLGSIPIADWSLVFNSKELIISSKSAIWGSVMGLLSMYVVKKLLNFRAPIMDSFAFFLPVVMIFQRIACLCAGCCFGTCTDSALGISYAGPGLLREVQLSNALIDQSAWISMPVHPVPLYFICGNLLTLIILLIVKKRLNNPGSLILLSISLLLGFRFCIEFFRDPVTNHHFSDMFLGIKVLQWILLGFFFIAVLGFVKKERQQVGISVIEPVRHLHNASIMFFLSMFYLIFQNIFSAEELVILKSLLIISLMVTVISFVKSYSRYTFPISPVIMMIFAIVLMSQTSKVESDPIKRKTKHFIKANSTYNNLRGTRYPCKMVDQGCTSYCAILDSTQAHGPYYTSYNLGYEANIPVKKASNYILGIEGQMERYYSDSPYKLLQDSRYNIHGYAGFEISKYFGAMVGMRVGSIFNYEDEVNTNHKVLPTIKVWAGNKDYATAGFGIWNGEQMGVGPSIANLFVNINPKILGLKKWELISLHHSSIWENFPNKNNLWSVNASYSLNRRCLITPRLGMSFGFKPYGFHAGLGIKYQLGK